jgi:hypothetical protein
MKDPAVTEALALSDEEFERRYWKAELLEAGADVGSIERARTRVERP